jgi:hypothetical protein
VVGGLYGECVADLVTPFAGALEHLEQAHGYRTGLVPVGGRSSSASNAAQIRDFLAALPPAEVAEKLILIGYSKGVCDVLEAIVASDEVRRRVDAVVSLAGAVAGSILAEDLPGPLETLLRRLDLPFCDPGDGGGIESLRRSSRVRWLANHALPLSVRYYSLVALPAPDRVSAILRPGYRQIAHVDPRNDGQMIWADAIVPGGALLGYANADHWAVALPIVRMMPPGLRSLAAGLLNCNAFPREVLLEAVVRHVEEDLLGFPDRGRWGLLARLWAGLMGTLDRVPLRG